MVKIVRPHDASWKAAFESEASRVRGALGDALLELHHIGSTAIPGLMAKPVIDILGEARALHLVDARNLAMQSLGYDARGAYGIEGRRYFSKTDAEGAGFHVHVFKHGDAHIARHLRFRDFLLERPDIAHEYSELKRALCDENGVLVADYVARKAPFIARVEEMALAHFKARKA